MTITRSVGLAVAAFALFSNTAAAGPIFNGHEYEVVVAEGRTWNQARADALALGAGWDLASIGSAAEDAFVAGLLNSGLPDRSHFWIGATDGAVEGTWQWVDGTPFVYTNWWGGEPNNVLAFDPVVGEDYLAYDLHAGAGWQWNDAGDSLVTVYQLSRGYVAERAVPEPASLSLIGLGIAGAALARRRRAAR